jgi:hypothetical protein
VGAPREEGRGCCGAPLVNRAGCWLGELGPTASTLDRRHVPILAIS